MRDLRAWFLLSRCYASVSTRRRRGGGKGRYAGSFSACNREQLCKTSLLFDEDKGKVRVKGKRLTPLHGQWGQLCGCIRGYCYHCRHMLSSPVHVWWMNHLAIGRAGSYCLCNKQKCTLHTVTTTLVLQRVLHCWTNEKSIILILNHEVTRPRNAFCSY